MPPDRHVEDILPELKASQADWNMSIRMSIIKLMLTDRLFFSENFRQLKPEYFPDDASQAILKFAFKYFSAYKNLPPHQIVYEELEHRYKDTGDWSEIKHQMNQIYEHIEPLVHERPYLQAHVTEFCKSEAMKTALRQCLELVRMPDAGDKRYEEMHSIFKDALSVGIDIEAGDYYFDTYQERYDQMLESKNMSVDKFCTGIPGIDSSLEGGLNRKEVALIAGLSGSGKSMLLVSMAVNLVASGRKVLFITLENSKRVTESRIDACITGIPAKMLQDKHHIKDDQGKSILDKKLQKVRDRRHGDLYVAEFPMAKTSVEELEAFEQQLRIRDQWFADAVIIDYLDELKMPSGMELHLAQADVLGKIKGWMQQTSRDIGMFGLTATQVNRVGAAVPVITEVHLASSFNKIFKVDACWSININSQDEDMGLARIYAIKHRNAPAHFLIYTKFDRSTCRITQISQDEYTKLVLQAKPSSQNASNIR